MVSNSHMPNHLGEVLDGLMSIHIYLTLTLLSFQIVVQKSSKIFDKYIFLVCVFIFLWRILDSDENFILLSLSWLYLTDILQKSTEHWNYSLKKITLIIFESHLFVWILFSFYHRSSAQRHHDQSSAKYFLRPWLEHFIVAPREVLIESCCIS